MKITFKCNKKSGKKILRTRDIIIGDKYKCIKTHCEQFSNQIIFKKGKWYEARKTDKLSMTFSNETGGGYYLKTYVKDTLFRHFDLDKSFREYQSEQRIEKLGSILDPDPHL